MLKWKTSEAITSAFYDATIDLLLNNQKVCLEVNMLKRLVLPVSVGEGNMFPFSLWIFSAALYGHKKRNPIR